MLLRLWHARFVQAECHTHGCHILVSSMARLNQGPSVAHSLGPEADLERESLLKPQGPFLYQTHEWNSLASRHLQSSSTSESLRYSLVLSKICIFPENVNFLRTVKLICPPLFPRHLAYCWACVGYLINIWWWILHTHARAHVHAYARAHAHTHTNGGQVRWQSMPLTVFCLPLS